MRLVQLGYISGVFGIQGWVKVYSWTEPKQAIFDYQPWLLGDSQRPIEIEQARRQGDGLVAKLDGIDEREQAFSLRGATINVFRQQLPDLRSGQYYWADLEGLAVVTSQGERLGRIKRLMATGANDVMVVQGTKEYLIPFVQPDYVKRVDLQAGEVQVDWDPDF